jgi:hypothetical protein
MADPSVWRFVVGVYILTVKKFVMKFHKGPQIFWMNNKT